MNIKLIYYLLLICFFSISCSPSTETENIDIDTDIVIDPVLSTKANILLLIADDFGKGFVRKFGATSFHAPRQTGQLGKC